MKVGLQDSVCARVEAVTAQPVLGADFGGVLVQIEHLADESVDAFDCHAADRADLALCGGGPCARSPDR